MSGTWQPLALAADIAPGTSAGTRLDGRELVVWRDAAGSAHVWEDRCPHRGMRLSFGYVRGDRIACIYHGWQYDGSGQCRWIPAHPDLTVPPSIRVAGYPVAESAGVIWTCWPGDDAGAPADDPPEPPADIGPTIPVRSLYLDCGAAVARAAFGATPLALIEAAGIPVAVAVQPLAAQSSALHIVIRGPAAQRSGADQRRVSAWAEALRARLEAGASGPGAMEAVA